MFVFGVVKKLKDKLKYMPHKTIPKKGGNGMGKDLHEVWEHHKTLIHTMMDAGYILAMRLIQSDIKLDDEKKAAIAIFLPK